MEADEDSGFMQRLHSSFGTSSSSIPKQQNHQFDSPIYAAPRIDAPTMPQFSQMITSQSSNKKLGMPPSHPHLPPSSPYSMSTPPSRLASQQLGLQSLSPRGSSHSRSLSQPTFFSLDSLPPLSPLPYRESSAASSSESVLIDVSMEERNCSLNASLLPASLAGGNALRVNEGLPPRKGHRRSNSDIPLGFSAMIQSSPQLIPITSQGISDKLVFGRDNLGVGKPIQLVKRESEWNKDGNRNAEGIGDRQSEGDVVDDLFRTYMNLDNIDTLTSSATEDKDLDSRASDKRTNGGDSSDNEVESGINRIINSIHRTRSSFPTEKREGVKRSASEDIAPTSRHYRSISMDSFMGNFNFGDESPNIPPSLGTQVSQHSPSNSIDGSSSKFSMDFGNGDFSGAELKKIMVNEKLSEIALSDPKRAKRILANRQSAARSKERKVRYMSELEHKVQTLQAEATTLSTQVTVLQRDSAGLTSENNELKFRLQAMEQQAQLRDALHETLTAEVQRLKLTAAEFRGETHLSNSMAQKLSFNRSPFQLQHQQPAQLNIYQLQQHQEQLQQAQHPHHNQKLSLEKGEAAKHGSN